MMKSLLIQLLESFGYDVCLQGTLEPDEKYPDTLITFLIIDSYNAADFDNETALTALTATVNVYCVDPSIVQTLSNDIRKKLKAAGFIPDGRGRDLISSENNYTGWTCDYSYLEREAN